MSDSKKRSRSRSDVKVAFQNLDVPQGLSDKERELRAQAAEAIRSSIADLAVDKATQAITAASLANQKALSAVNEELVTKLELLKNIKENIDLESKDIDRLYGIRVLSEHLDVLKAEHDEAKAALEKEILEQRAWWKEEKAREDRERIRNNEDYAYKLAQSQQLANDAWESTIRARNVQEQTRMEVFEKNWRQREDELKLREKELTDLRALVAAHPTQLDAEVKKAVAIESNRLTRDHKHATELLEKDRASEKALYESDKKALTEQLAAAKKLNEELTLSLASAHTKNADIATKALEASSGQAALSAVQNFAKDQGNNGPAKRS